MHEILITGATGNVGREIVEHLIGKVPLRIAATHVKRATAMFGNEPTFVHFDFLDADTFGATFAHITNMFLVRPPALSNVKRDIAPALVAARAAGVKRIVFLSLQGVEKNPIVPHYKIEQLVVELGFAYTFLRAGFFMQNLSTTHAAEIRDHSEIALPVGAAKTSFIDVRDIAAAAARILTEVGHENRAYTLTGSEALDYYQVAEIMSVVLERKIRYTNPNLVEFVRRELGAGRPLAVTLVMAGLYTITRWGSAKEVTDEVQQILGRTPISLQQFVNDYKACWLSPTDEKLASAAP